MIGRRSTILLLIVGMLNGCGQVEPVQSMAQWWRQLEPHAQLYFPEHGNAPYPAVVLFHGCSGLHGRGADYARIANRLGFVAVIVDSLAARGISASVASKEVCGRSRLRGDQRAVDVVAVIEHLAARTDIDGDRINLVGFSHGGWTVLELIDDDQDHWTESMTPGGRRAVAELDGVLLVYPYCEKQMTIQADAMRGTGLHVVVVRDDASVDEQDCLALVEQVRAQGKPVSVAILEGPGHAFDMMPVEKMSAHETLFARVAEQLFVDFLLANTHSR